ncbi:MAG TPA: hypothetical protein VKU02_01435 [Gemmataceae bacterium]|nr:hypothetical protein [Gemmataceae bacterium]
MSDALPCEVTVTELPDGVHYRLPRRKAGQFTDRAKFHLFVSFLAVPFLSFWLWIVGSGIDWHDLFRPENGFLLIFLAAGVWMLFLPLCFAGRAVFLYAGHSEIELRCGILRRGERWGWLRWGWKRSIAGLCRFDVCDALMEKGMVRVYANPAAATESNMIVPVWDKDGDPGAKRNMLAPGYPRAWLLPLASDLARRCQLGVVEQGALLSQATPIAVAAEPLPNSAGFVDLLTQPAGSKTIVSQTPEAMTVIVPSKWSRRKNAVLVVAGDNLAVLEPKLFGAERHQWSRSQLADVRVGKIMDSEGPDTPVLHIQPYPGEGKRFRLPLEDEAEARWLATILRHALHMAEETPPSNAAPFLERPEQPAGSRIVQQMVADDVTLTVPPPGFGQTDVRNQLLCSLISFGVSALVAALLCLIFKDRAVWLLIAGIGGVLGIAFLVDAVSRARRQLVLTVAGDTLSVQQLSLYGVRHEQWPRWRLADVRVGDTLVGRIANAYLRQLAYDRAEPRYELQVHLRNGDIVRFLDGYGDAELQWLATVLRRALHVPEENSAA